MTTATAMPEITYGVANIKSYEAKYDDKGGVDTLVIDNKVEAKPTPRFWTSLWCQYSSYGLSPKLPKLFTHREIFDRLFEKLPERGGELRYTIESGPNGNRLLGLSRPTKAIMDFNPTLDLIRRNAVAAGEVSYNSGLIRANHAPAHMADFTVGPDDFAHRYITETPIDGFGLPSMFLSLFRYVCSNGAIAMTPAFRSSINLGANETDPVHTMARALDSFNNEEGFAALRQRFESASKSWASIRECQKGYKIMADLADAGHLGYDVEAVPQDPKHAWTRDTVFNNGRKGMLDELCSRRSVARRVSEDNLTMRERINRAYLQMSGDIIDLYKLTSIDALTDKKQSQLPARCTVYDLLNLSTELSTHYATAPFSARKIDAFVGDLVASDYDLEGSREAKPNYQDFFTSV